MAETEEKNTEASRHKRIIAEAKARFKKCQDADSEQRALALADLEFLDGQQWSEAVKAQRQRAGRPALVVNRLDQFVQQITNALRQNRIAGRVFPVDDVADPDTAEVMQGHIRHIEYDSDGDLAYHTGAFYAVAMGWGVWRLITKYCSPLSFDLDIKIERVRNPFQVYFDPGHTHPTGKDARHGFVFTKYTREEFETEFPNSVATKTRDWEGFKDESGWFDEEGALVVEYLTIESTEDTLVRLIDGSARLKSELGEDFDQSLIATDAKGKPIERETAIEVVRWYKLNGEECMDETVWPTMPDYVSVPLIKVIGNELDVNGKLKLKGIIRNLKDAQNQYNFMLSAQTEAIDSSKGQIILREGQIEGHEREWGDAANRKVLTIKDTTIDGKPAPDPTRLQPNVSIPAMTEARLMAADDLKALTGIYDAALGAKSNETSGIAIRGRQAQSDTANYHFTGNLVRSINHSCRLILGAIPTVYDTPRSIRVVGEGDAHKVVRINEEFEEQKQKKKYDYGVGKYDVVCEAGPSPETKQEQDQLMMTEIIKVAPQLMEIAPDLVLKAVGAPTELVERVRKSLPPQFQDDKDEQPSKPEDVQMIQDLQQQLKVRDHVGQEMHLEIEQYKAGAQVKQMEIEHKERIEAMKYDFEKLKLQTQAQIEAEKLHSAESTVIFKGEVDLQKNAQNLDAQAAAAEASQAAEAI